jgi:hypothetical protein
MTNHPNPAKHAGHGDYERSDIGVSGIIYFLISLAVGCVVAYFVARGLYSVLDKHFEATQPPLSPLVANAPADTRSIPPEYKTDSEGTDYQKYLEKNFPSPQLETNERTELNEIRLREENTLSTYDWIDQKAGTVRIPIDRAMELVAQRGLPVRAQSSTAAGSSTEKMAAAPADDSGKNKTEKKQAENKQADKKQADKKQADENGKSKKGNK